MKYSSLREYFYKLHNYLYAIILLPFLTFVVLYWQMQEGNLEGPFRTNEWYRNVMMGACGLILTTDWILSAFLFAKGLKATHSLDSLGNKLDRYFSFVLFRFAIVTSGALTLAIAFYLTESQYFTVMFVLNMLLLFFFWPTPGRACDDLLLKGDERTLVQYKMDRL
jgi:hypothetical protein